MLNVSQPASARNLNCPAKPDGLRHRTLAGPLLHFVYSYLLRDCLTLSARDARDLATIGFCASTIARAGYKSSPAPSYFKSRDGKAERYDISKLVIESEINKPEIGGAILHSSAGFRVPGFYSDGAKLRLNFSQERLVAPVKNARAQIVALQTYRRATDAWPQWFDSAGLPRGARAQRSPHFARPALARESGAVVIAEHTIAADLHAWCNDEPAVAVNDLLPDAFARSLRAQLPEVSLVAFAFPLPDVEMLGALEAMRFEVYNHSLYEVIA